MHRASALSGSPAATSNGPFERIIAALERLTPLDDADKHAIRALPHEVKSCADGETLVEAGRIQDRCHLLLTAVAHKLKYSGDLRRVVAINLPGEIVNTESLLGLESDYAAHVFRPGDVAIIPAESLRELVFTHPTIARALWLRNQAEAAVYREWLLNDQRRSLKSRMAHLLAETAVRLHLINSDGAGDDRILHLGVEELAQALGSVPLYVDRELAALRDDGVVEITPEGVTVEDSERLAEIGQFEPQYLQSVYGTSLPSAC